MKKLLFSFYLLFFPNLALSMNNGEEYFVLDKTQKIQSTKIMECTHLHVDYPVSANDIKKLKYLQKLESLTLGNEFHFNSELSRQNFFKSLQKLENLLTVDLSNQEFSSAYLKYLPKSLKKINLSYTFLLASAKNKIPESIESVDIRGTFLAKKMDESGDYSKGFILK